VPNAIVTITPSSGSENILFFDPSMSSLAPATRVLPGDPQDAAFLILNVDPTLGPFTVVARDAITGTVLGTVENVVVQPSDFARSDAVWTEVIFEVGTCPVCDINLDGTVDIQDISAIFESRGATAAFGDPRDTDGDGIITVNDARICTLLCTKPGCSK
jgi:hypothetical protein